MAGNKGKSHKKSRLFDTSIQIGGNVDTGGGDIATGDISKENVNIYRISEMKTSTINSLFQPIYKKLDQLSEIHPQDRKILHKNIEEIQHEVLKGQKVDRGFVEERLLHIARMAPDIFEVVISILANPAIGLAIVAKKIAKKAEDEKKNE